MYFTSISLLDARMAAHRTRDARTYLICSTSISRPALSEHLTLTGFSDGKRLVVTP